MIIGNEFFYASNGCATAYIPLPLPYMHESQVAAMKYTYYTDEGTQLFTSLKPDLHQDLTLPSTMEHFLEDFGQLLNSEEKICIF